MDKLMLSLSAKELQIVVAALAELPAKHVHELLNNIQAQVQQQSAAAASQAQQGEAHGTAD